MRREAKRQPREATKKFCWWPLAFGPSLTVGPPAVTRTTSLTASPAFALANRSRRSALNSKHALESEKEGKGREGKGGELPLCVGRVAMPAGTVQSREKAGKMLLVCSLLSLCRCPCSLSLPLGFSFASSGDTRHGKRPTRPANGHGWGPKGPPQAAMASSEGRGGRGGEGELLLRYLYILPWKILDMMSQVSLSLHFTSAKLRDRCILASSAYVVDARWMLWNVDAHCLIVSSSFFTIV
jgi:hypothetical protein